MTAPLPPSPSVPPVDQEKLTAEARTALEAGDWRFFTAYVVSDLLDALDAAEKEVARYRSFCGEALCGDVEHDIDAIVAAVNAVPKSCFRHLDECWTPIASGECICGLHALMALVTP